MIDEQISAMQAGREEVVVRYARTLREKGFTLIEALVGIMILMFGLLGVITMLDVSYSSGTLSRNMTMATELGTHMLDRIRFDSITVDDPLVADIEKLRSFSNTGGSVILDTNNANPALEPGLSAFQEWQQLVRTNLPNGRGIVTIVPFDPTRANNHSVSVRITWKGVLTRGVVLETVLARGNVL